MKKIVTKMMEYPSEKGTTPGYLAQPADEESYPGLVIIQEWWGLVPHIREVAERFAREGFIVLLPDLYHGKETEEPDEARKLAMALDRDDAVAEIVDAIHYLQSLDQVSSQKIGVVGWCMGGGLALSTAAESADVGAVVAFYGRPLDEEDAARIEAPVLGLYAEKDQGIPVDSVRQFEDVLEEHDIPHEIHVYPGAEHAFFNDTREAYNADYAMDAWERTLAWFDEYLE